jgi:hypothetical protein
MTALTPTEPCPAPPAPAAGAPLRVVLYACIPLSDGADPGRVLARLEQYAATNGWDVWGEYVDRGPLNSPTALRPAWARVVEAIETGRAHGIVAPAEAMCAYYPHQREQLKTWLAQNGAFAAYAVRPVTVTPPQRTRGHNLDAILSCQPSGPFPTFVGRASLPPVVQADALVLPRIRDPLPELAVLAACLPVTCAGADRCRLSP